MSSARGRAARRRSAFSTAPRRRPFAELANFLAYDSHFLGGVYVAAGNVRGTRAAEVITGAGEGGGPHVRVFQQGSASASHRVSRLRSAVYRRRAVGINDVNGDGRLDILTGPGPTGGPDIRGYDGTSRALLTEFSAFDAAFHGGVYVAGDPQP